MILIPGEVAGLIILRGEEIILELLKGMPPANKAAMWEDHLKWRARWMAMFDPTSPTAKAAPRRRRQ